MIGRWLGPLRSAALGGALVGAVLCAAAWAAEPLAAENAWVPWAPPALKVHAAYMTIVNRGATDQSIVGARSAGYERIELHRSAVKDGVSVMQTVDEVTVPANGRVELAPAGLHFMLIGPKRAPAIDDRVDIVLRLRGGDEVAVGAVVRQRGAANHGEHGHHGGAR